MNAEIIGLAGGTLTTVSVVPQIIRLYRLKSAREISLLFNILLLSGVILWLVYGIYLELPSVILWNAITAVLVGALLCLKLRYSAKGGLR